MESRNNYNYEDICILCREHYQEIVERKDLAYILQNKKVRYIDPEGHWGYTTFGNFYVTSRDAMMLVTREFPIARYHQPDSMRDSLWSTVPVLFAGIETGMRDSKGQDIYTGDVLEVSKPTHCKGIAVYFPDADIPCVRLDNHCLFFDGIKRCEIMGNVFFDIDEVYYEYYYFNHFFSNNPFFQGPVSNDEWEERINKIKNAPSFLNGKPQPKERYSMIYLKNISEVKYDEGDYLVTLCDDHDYDPNDEDTYPVIYIDPNVIPKDCPLRCKDIPFNFYHPDWAKAEKRIDELLLEAHNNPDTKYFLCDMQTYVLDKKQYHQIAELFKKAHDFQIRNFILPFEIAMYE